MSKTAYNFMVWMLAATCGWLIGCGIQEYEARKSNWIDGAVICVVAGSPDITIISPKIRYLGDGKWEFLTEAGDMSIVERGSMSSCFIASRPKEAPKPPVEVGKYDL